MTGWIAITSGDSTGIGPEVTLKALAALAGRTPARFLILGDESVFYACNAQLKLGLDLRGFQGPGSEGQFFLHNPGGVLPQNLTSGSPAVAKAALDCLRDGAYRCLRQEVDALVTAPVNKQSILRLGEAFVGQTEFLSQLAGTDRTAMMLLGEDGQGHVLRVALATTHVPLRLVAEQLTQSKIEIVIDLAGRACADLGLRQARLGVCALNPHAGEGGELGDEELKIISPAVTAARDRGVDVSGPFGADSLFYHAFHGAYDAVVAMYHDQGLVPLKMIGFEQGVNWTLGLPFVRTSPDHGTAYNIAGRGIANGKSMLAAIQLALKLTKNWGASAEGGRSSGRA